MAKIAIVTGAMGGIGLATVRLLAKQGMTVVGASRRDGEEIRAKFTSEGGSWYCSADMSVPEDRERLVRETMERYGKIDILVNVAGVAPAVRMDLLDMTEESYDRVMDINLKSTMFLTQMVAKHMLNNPLENGIRGYIVNISSLSAYTSSTSRGEYCMSKAGLSMLTKLFADRLAAHGIPVNEIRPGIIATDMTATVKGKYDKLIEEGLLPIPRWGEPEDVAKAVVALCDGTLAYTTGQSIDVDGGFHIRRL